LAVLLHSPTSARSGVSLSPALAAAKARGVNDRRACAAPARPAVTPVPAPPSAVELCALLDAAAQARGVARGVDFRRYASCRALLAALHRAARVHARGRPVSGTVRSSWGWLAKLVDELLAWEQQPDHDHYENAQRRRSSLRRWLRELEACGLLRATIVCDDEGQERGVDVELRPVPALAPEALERAAARLARWRRRYGDGKRLAACRSGAILARLEDKRRATAQRYPRRQHASTLAGRHAEGASRTFGPPLTGAFGDAPDSPNPSAPCKASCGARERAQWPRVTRSPGLNTISANAAINAATAASKDGGREARLRARWESWEQRVAAADAACRAFVATVAAPLPALPVLRLALAGRGQGVVALAAGEPVAGLGPRLLRRLARAAARWVRWSLPGAPSPAAELLRRADEQPFALELDELVRGFAVDARQLARRVRTSQSQRLDVAHRRARRQQAALLAAWPAWLLRDGDRLVLDCDHRFLQVHRLPTRVELDDPQLRCWLRAITALQWHAPAPAVELTDPDGRYAYVPLDAAQLALEGERTRGPWISYQPSRQQARERARRQIESRHGRHRPDPHG
jgi:hypothetical protein